MLGPADAETQILLFRLTGLVIHLLNEPSRDPAIMAQVHKLVLPGTFSASLAFSPDSLNKLGPCSPADADTLLWVMNAVAEATRAAGLVWIPHFRRVEETSLVAASGAQAGPAAGPQSNPARPDLLEVWKVELEWELVYEPPPVGMTAGMLPTTKKRFKLWRSPTRTVHLLFALDNTPFEGPQGQQANPPAHRLVSLEYALGAPPPPAALWTSVDAILPASWQHYALYICKSLLLALVRLGVTLCTTPSDGTAPLDLPDPEASSAPIHLRHHARHYEPELQAEPTPRPPPPPPPSSDVIGTRRRWAVGSSTGRGGPSPEFGTPATTSAAAHLHLERPLAERHVHSDPGYLAESAHRSSEAARSRSGREPAASPVHEPSHPHPLPRRQHDPPPQLPDEQQSPFDSRHHHRHRHRRHRVGGGFVFRVLSLPRRFIAMLVQIVQIIVVDFLAVGNIFGSIIEVTLNYLQPPLMTTTTAGLGPDGAVLSPGEPTTPSKRVSFAAAGEEAEEDLSDGTTSASKRGRVKGSLTLPATPPPSPHLPAISGASSSSSSSSSPSHDNYDNGGASEDVEWVATTLPIPRSAREVRPSGLVLGAGSRPIRIRIPFPSEVDALALALHEQLAHEAAARAQQQPHAPGPEPPRIGARAWMAHDVVASEAASRARELDHLERMREKYAATGGPGSVDPVEERPRGFPTWVAAESEEEVAVPGRRRRSSCRHSPNLFLVRNCARRSAPRAVPATSPRRLQHRRRTSRKKGSKTGLA